MLIFDHIDTMLTQFVFLPRSRISRHVNRHCKA
ncbi:hypothetical protein MED222_05125 [Vibrio sp. MED222]|nr:hypothetical protein MED222_05125 [Vibrio sp. MED222]